MCFTRVKNQNCERMIKYVTDIWGAMGDAIVLQYFL